MEPNQNLSTVLLYKCSWFGAKNIDQMCTSYKLKKQLFDRKVYIVSRKKQTKCTCHRTTFYSVFNISSCRNLELQNVCLQSTKSSEFAKHITIK